MPAWAKRVIQRLHKPPEVIRSNGYESLLAKVKEPFNFDKSAAATIRLANIELKRLAQNVRSVQDPKEIQNVFMKVTRSDVLHLAAIAI